MHRNLFYHLGSPVVQFSRDLFSLGLRVVPGGLKQDNRLCRAPYHYVFYLTPSISCVERLNRKMLLKLSDASPSLVVIVGS